MNCWLCGGPRPGCACTGEHIDDAISGRPIDPSYASVQAMQNIIRAARDIDLRPLQVGIRELAERVYALGERRRTTLVQPE